jgi:hypothetical protein
MQVFPEHQFCDGYQGIERISDDRNQTQTNFKNESRIVITEKKEMT